MANPEHVKLVKRGAAAVAPWRREHGGERLDLRDADLRNADFRNANLSDANLRGADLRNTNFRNANVFNANLRGANLGNANLRSATFIEANLKGAELHDANLSDANFSGAILDDVKLLGAKLVGTNFSGADLRRATLARAALDETVLADTDLAGAKGLEAVHHVGPSIIDHRTIERSGELPLTFLRGCGLADELIDFYTAQYGKKIHFYSVFISYARKDEEFVDQLYANLQNNGVRCWRDTEDMKIGDRKRSPINRAIRLHDKLVLVLSERSIHSDWVESEVEAAFEKERKDGRTVLFPIRLDDAVMETDKAWAAEIRRTRNIGDFRGWKDHDSYQPAFERVLRDLRPEAE